MKISEKEISSGNVKRQFWQGKQKCEEEKATEMNCWSWMGELKCQESHWVVTRLSVRDNSYVFAATVYDSYLSV